MNIRILLLLVVLAICVSGCSKKQTQNDGFIEETGTIMHLRIEGGFYGIVTDAGGKYDPINLPDDMKKDGLRVSFKARPRNDIATFHMWGQLVELVDIKEIDK